MVHIPRFYDISVIYVSKAGPRATSSWHCPPSYVLPQRGYGKLNPRRSWPGTMSLFTDCFAG